MQQRTCPRCGVVIPDDAQWEPLDTVAGRAPVYRNRHERPGGKGGDRKCVLYSGEGQANAVTSGFPISGDIGDKA